MHALYRKLDIPSYVQLTLAVILSSTYYMFILCRCLPMSI